MRRCRRRYARVRADMRVRAVTKERQQVAYSEAAAACKMQACAGRGRHAAI